MSCWKITAVGPQERKQYAGLVLAAWRGLLEETETELFLASEAETAHGALLARTEDENYEIISLFVEEAWRGRGAASALLEAAQRAAQLGGFGAVEVVYAVTAEEEEAVHRFFLSRGFLFPRVDSSLYSVFTPSLVRSHMAKLPAASASALSHIAALDRLPPQTARAFAASFGRKIPAGLAPSAAPGEVLQEYSGAYLDKDGIIAFVVFSRVDASVHLHAAYLRQPQHGMALAFLLRRAYDKLVARDWEFKTFTVTVINDAAKALVETLLAGAEIERRTVFHTQKLLMRPSPTAPGWGGVLARTNALVDAMAQAGYGTAMCMEPGTLPYLLWRPQKGMEVSIFYQAEDEEYASFSLTAQLLLQIEDEEAASCVRQAAEDPGPAWLLPSDDAGVYALSCTSQEESEFYAEQSIAGFLEPFFEQAKRITQLPGVRVV